MSPTAHSETYELRSNGSVHQHSPPFVNVERTVTPNEPRLSRGKATAIIVSIACSTMFSSIVNGMFTVEVPTIARDVRLSQDLLLWPQSVVSLVSACTLLLAGSISDVLGSRPVYIAGSSLQTAFILGAGLARSGSEILLFRAFMGVAQSMFLTSSVSIIMNSFPGGRRRNVAFACMGGGQPLGFSIGLVLAGLFTESVGWRFGLFLVSGLNAAGIFLAAFSIADTRRYSFRELCSRIKRDIDWIGTLIASASLGMLCFVLASISVDTSNIKSPSNITLLCVSVVLVPTFIFWMHRQVRKHRPALIPNSLWRSRVFSSICLCVFFTWGSFSTFEQLLSLWLQLVQRNSPLETSLRFLPQTVVGIVVNAGIGLFVHRFPVYWIIGISTTVSLAAPIIMGLSGTDWIYWAASFPAISLNVVGADSLYTIANLLISSRFPNDKQGLTGGVFNTLAQVGKSIGLALSAVVSNTIMEQGTARNEVDRLAEGYRGGIWFCLALNVTTLCVSFWGLRGCGRIKSE